MAQKTFGMVGPRPPISTLSSDEIRERMGHRGVLDTAFILKTDNSVSVSMDPINKVYNIRSNLKVITVSAYVEGALINLPSEQHGVQEILINVVESNDSPEFGEFVDYTVTGRTIDLGTNKHDGKFTYVKFLTVKQ